MTPAGLARLKEDEGFVPAAEYVAFRDTRGNWTIAGGITGAGIVEGTRWSAAQADAAWAQRVVQAEGGLRRLWPAFDTIDPVRQDVLVNVAFNVGDEGLLHWPVTLAAVAAHRYIAAANDIEDNAVWGRQVGAREHRCGEAMRSGSWS